MPNALKCTDSTCAPLVYPSGKIRKNSLSKPIFKCVNTATIYSVRKRKPFLYHSLVQLWLSVGFFSGLVVCGEMSEPSRIPHCLKLPRNPLLGWEKLQSSSLLTLVPPQRTTLCCMPPLHANAAFLNQSRYQQLLPCGSCSVQGYQEAAVFSHSW